MDIELANIPTNAFVSPTSRYIQSTTIYWGKDRLLTFKIYKRTPTSVSPQDKFMVIPGPFQYRPDLISNRVYGTPDFWWKILEANDMSDIWQFKAGTNIRLPS